MMIFASHICKKMDFSTKHPKNTMRRTICFTVIYKINTI